MDIISKNEHLVFKNEKDNKVSYSIGISKKKEDGTYENGYIPVRFRKDIELNDRTKIKIKSAWLDFFKIEKRTMLYIFINDFEKVENEVQQQKSVDNWDAGKNVEIDDDMLPFY
jgi:hypothetical protein